MAIITLSHPVAFPIPALRGLLQEHVPMYRWKCGEDDQGGHKDITTFERTQMVLGRGLEDMILVSVAYVPERYAPQDGSGVPQHRCHILVSAPTTELDALARRISALLCAGLMIQQDEDAHCQLAPGKCWLSTEDMRTAMAVVKNDTNLDILDRMGRAPSAFAAGITALPVSAPLSEISPQRRSAATGYDALGAASLNRTFARVTTELFGEDFARMAGQIPPPPYANEGVRIDRFPAMVLMLDLPLTIAWPELHGLVQRIDPEGEWQCDCRADGSGTISGRSSRIDLTVIADPVPRYLIESGFSRSFWFEANRDRVYRHTSQLVVASQLDTRAVPYEDVAMTAKVVTLILAMIARQPGVAALYNAGVETILEAERTANMLGILARNEIPIPLWTWTAPHALEDEAITLTTGGFAPFLGYEIEVWNAPHDRDVVKQKLDFLLRYLLHSGPVIDDGDTVGETVGDQSIRCFFGDSRVDRTTSVRAMFVEFDSPGITQPRRDSTPVPLTPMPRAAPRRAPVGFGRKGL